MSAQPPLRPPTSPPPPPPYEPPNRRGRNIAILATAAVALVVIGGLGYWLGGRDTTPGAAPPSATTTPSAGPSTLPSTSVSAPASASASAASAPSATPGTTTTTASPTPTVSVTTTPPHPDPDFGYVTGLTTVGGVNKITFDRATIYSGAAAQSAAKAHGQTVEDDYFIVNDNPLIRTFELSPTVVVTGSTNLSNDVGPKPSSVAALKAWIDAHPKQPLPVNLSYDPSGKVSKIAEMFFP